MSVFQSSLWRNELEIGFEFNLVGRYHLVHRSYETGECCCTIATQNSVWHYMIILKIILMFSIQIKKNFEGLLSHLWCKAGASQHYCRESRIQYKMVVFLWFWPYPRGFITRNTKRISLYQGFIYNRVPWHGSCG